MPAKMSGVRFASAGPGGGIRFVNLGTFMGGGMPRGGRVAGRGAAAQAPEMPAGIKKAQEVMQALGPATPLVFVLVAYLAILVFGTLFSHLLSKSYLVASRTAPAVGWGRRSSPGSWSAL